MRRVLRRKIPQRFSGELGEMAMAFIGFVLDLIIVFNSRESRFAIFVGVYFTPAQIAKHYSFFACFPN